jgi:hypothetical protein
LHGGQISGGTVLVDSVAILALIIVFAGSIERMATNKTAVER